MSERVERIRSCLTTEWKSTQEIADEAGVTAICHPLATVYRQLSKWERWGDVERRVIHDPKTPGHHRAEWRLRR